MIRDMPIGEFGGRPSPSAVGLLLPGPSHVSQDQRWLAGALAVMFHDAACHAGATDNEERPASLLRDAIAYSA